MVCFVLILAVVCCLFVFSVALRLFVIAVQVFLVFIHGFWGFQVWSDRAGGWPVLCIGLGFRVIIVKETGNQRNNGGENSSKPRTTLKA